MSQQDPSPDWTNSELQDHLSTLEGAAEECNPRDICVPDVQYSMSHSESNEFKEQTLREMAESVSCVAERSQEQVQSTENAPLTVGASNMTFTLDVVRQDRPGSKRGMGRRKYTGNVDEKRARVPPLLESLACRTLLGLFEGVGKRERLVSQFNSSSIAVVGVPAANVSPSTWGHSMSQHFEGLLPIAKHEKKWFHVLSKTSTLCICTRLPFSQVGATGAKSMDRHVVSTWIGKDGIVYCTCVGITQFRVHNGMPDLDDMCIYVQGFKKVLSNLASLCGASVRDCGKAITHLCQTMLHAVGATNEEEYPSAQDMFGRKHFLLSTSVDFPVPGTIHFIPIRIVKNSFFVCAFCDTVCSGGCMHTRQLYSCVGTIGEEEEVEITPHPATNLETDMSHCLSRLPLAPVNCLRSIFVDQEVADTARRKEIYLILVPSHCTCGEAKNPKTRKLWKGGVIMCTLGPCRMHVEEFDCSNKHCARKVHADGRDHCILLMNMTSGATHALLRRELTGVVSGNGTLNSRLRHYHSQVMGIVRSSVIPSANDTAVRSTRTLQDLCTLMLKLMTMEPEKSLFACETCMSQDDHIGDNIHALCIDGIELGYLKNKQVRLKNIAEPCDPVPVSRARVGSLHRPLSGLFRREKTIKMILSCQKGDSLSCTTTSLTDTCTFIRLISGEDVLDKFCLEAMCGNGRNDYSNDVGEHNYVLPLRNLTESLFCTSTLLYRLLKSLQYFFSTLSQSVISEYGRHSEVISRTNTKISELESTHASKRRVARQGVPWASFVTVLTEWDRDVCKDLQNVYRMLVQGPVCQFVRRSDITSLVALGHICLYQEAEDLANALKTPQGLGNSQTGETSFLDSCRLLQSALASVRHIELNRNGEVGKKLRNAFGSVFICTARCVSKFYSYYDSPVLKSTAVTYAQRWNSQDIHVLKQRMAERYPHTSNGWPSSLQEALCTGHYFPGRPQVRPLPFNRDEITSPKAELLGPCSKDYSQKTKGFTPGAMTISCSCRSPVTFGAKVLYRNEGPKVVLDMVLARFASFPRFIVYDFSCGLFSSAVNSLWWALEGTTIVSDKFHIGNHKSCSPSYNPKIYSELDSSNTVSHEQRNSRIQTIRASLRNSGHVKYISLLAYHTIVANIKAKTKASQKFKERTSLFSEHDLE